MEKGFRMVKCPNRECPKKIRIKVSERNYGKKGKIICPKCKEVFMVTIPVPAIDEVSKNSNTGDLFKTFNNIRTEADEILKKFS